MPTTGIEQLENYRRNPAISQTALQKALHSIPI